MHLQASLLVIWVGVICGVLTRGPIVSLKQGKYRGNYVSRANRYVQEYLGIPFAKPPVGDLRLANPERVEEQPDEIFEANKFGPSCPQAPDTMFGNFSGATLWNPPGEISEDCLYLNVWTPQRSGVGGRPMDVMVWIFGRGFFSGSTALDIYNGQTLADVGNLVVVSISYRVGALGFLSIGDERLPGNFGLMDQVMALRWIKDNIGAFQGDPNKVTLFGESSGAVSAFFHILSPLSSGLFQRAIIQSPADLFRDVESSARNARKLMDRLKCDVDGDFVACLRKASVDSFVKEQFEIKDDSKFSFQPTISPFMPKHPRELLEAGEFETKDILLGVNKNEGTYFMMYELKSIAKKDKVNGQTRDDVRVAIEHNNPDLNDEQRQRVFDHYTKGVNATDLEGNRDVIDNVIGDRFFKCPTNEIADGMSKHGGNTYFYYYNHRAEHEVWPKWMGVMHGAEIPFFFGIAQDYSKSYTPDERRFSARVMSYLTNFVKTGNPNNQGNRPWPKYTPVSKEYIELALHEQTHEGGYRSAQCKFWEEEVTSGATSQSAASFLAAAVAMVNLIVHLY